MVTTKPSRCTNARPRQHRGCAAPTDNLDSNRVAVGVQKVSSRVKRTTTIKRTSAKPKTLEGEGAKKKTRPRRATLQTPQSRVDSVSRSHQNPPEQLLSPSVSALTKSNLRADTQRTNPGEQPLAIMASSENSSAVKIQLARYGVMVDSTEPYPPPLKDFTSNTVKVPREGLARQRRKPYTRMLQFLQN